MSDSLGQELFQYMGLCLYNCPKDERDHVKWLMSPEWFNEALKVSDSSGHPIWQPIAGHETLWGFPVEIREDAGVPRLVWK